ncbi:MAG: alpha/beta hydrolase [Planctomycetes bacterium]|nr:alpha/beta hydrolase [Planctomycetota bacterium]
MIKGNRPVLLLIHGWSTSRKFWHPFINVLSEKYDLIIPDVPNFGGSYIPNYSFENCAEAIYDAICSNGYKIDYTLGHSMGGAITLLLTTKTNLNPKKIVLANSVIIGREALNPMTKLLTIFPIRCLPYFFYRFDLARFLMSHDYQNIKRISSEAAIDLRNQQYSSLIIALKGIVQQDLLSTLQQITIPTLAIINEDDPIISKHHNAVLSTCRNISLKQLQGAIHCPMYSTQLFFKTIYDFFGS